MATDLCWYFQVHQPWRLRHFRFMEVGKGHRYFDDEKNAAIMRKVAQKCYLPMNALLQEQLMRLGGEFKIAFSISGTAMQQMEAYCPEVLSSFKRLLDTGHVELLSETSHHSLAALFSPHEFRQQVKLHQEICQRLLGRQPSKVFRNTELITSDATARLVADLGYEAMLMEGADHILRWKSPLFKYRMDAAPELVALMKNYRLSDDIAFRFSDQNWSQWPLTSEKYAQWLSHIQLENPVSARGGRPFVGLFMDYETFGEHQWASTGIFDFMRALPERLLSTNHINFVTPTEAAALARTETFDFRVKAPEAFSWADVERDLSAWQGNPIQDTASRAAYSLEMAVREKAVLLGDGPGTELLETWRRLLTSDHYYYMCTKYFADGDVHKYFNPYESPYDAHIVFMNVIADMAIRCGVAPPEEAEEQESA